MTSATPKRGGDGKSHTSAASGSKNDARSSPPASQGPRRAGSSRRAQLRRSEIFGPQEDQEHQEEEGEPSPQDAVNGAGAGEDLASTRARTMEEYERSLADLMDDDGDDGERQKERSGPDAHVGYMSEEIKEPAWGVETIGYDISYDAAEGEGEEGPGGEVSGMDRAAYRARMREIMGSDASSSGDDDEDQDEAERAEVEAAAETSVATALPDVSLSSAVTTDQRSWRERRRRPAAYPALMRLRSSALGPSLHARTEANSLSALASGMGEAGTPSSMRAQTPSIALSVGDASDGAAVDESIADKAGRTSAGVSNRSASTLASSSDVVLAARRMNGHGRRPKRPRHSYPYGSSSLGPGGSLLPRSRIASSLTATSTTSSLSGFAPAAVTNGPHASARAARLQNPAGDGIDDATTFREPEEKVAATSPVIDETQDMLQDPLVAQSPATRPVFRWSVLRKLTNAAYPPSSRANHESATTSQHASSSQEADTATHLPEGGISRDSAVTGNAARSEDDDGRARPPRPTVLAISTDVIAVGLDDGKTLVFEYGQELKCSLGEDELATAAGSVTALAVSSDHTFVGVGHSNGHLALYDLAKPTSPARLVRPAPFQSILSGRREGHLEGSRIVSLGFVGARHTAIFSGDEHGLSFYHSLGKVLGVSSTDTLRILGKYPEAPRERTGRDGFAPAPSGILAMAPLPFGMEAHLSDQFHFCALLTPTKLVIVGIRPSARTWFRRVAPPLDAAPGLSQLDNDANLGTDPRGSAKRSHPVGAIAWLPALKADRPSSCTMPSGDVEPLLALSFSHHLLFIRIRKMLVQAPDGDAEPAPVRPRPPRSEITMSEERGYDHDESIVAMQWLSHEYLLLVGRSRLSVFDMRRRKCVASQTRHPQVHSLASWVSPRAQAEMEKTRQLAEVGAAETRIPVAHSVRTHQGKTFFLTQDALVVASLLSWADHLLQLVSGGDFLAAIDLATAMYLGTGGQAVIGLPEDADLQRELIAAKLRELMRASVQYSFSEERLTDHTHVTPDGRGVDRTSLFEGIARSCARACLALGDLNFLFDELYDLYADNGIEGIFVGQMEDFIVDGHMRRLPIPVVQRLVQYRKARGEYALAERIIWHVEPQSLDIDQALSLCMEQGLWDAMIYVYNAAMDDYVAPLVDLLGKLRSADSDTVEDEEEAEEVYKIYSYLSVALCGASYPSQEPLQPASKAAHARSSLYGFIFSGSCVSWPPGPGGKLALTTDDTEQEPTYPYLRLLLRFDAEAMLDALDVAFEDSYLDDDDEEEGRGKGSDLRPHGFGPDLPASNYDPDASSASLQVRRPTATHSRFTRQRIVSILLEVAATSSDPPAARLAPHDLAFLDIFVARNAPKFPQFVRLTQDQVRAILTRLTDVKDRDAASDSSSPGASDSQVSNEKRHDEDDPGASDVAEGGDQWQETKEDRQLAAESLLSAYSVRFSEDLLARLEKAGFHRILQGAFRAERKWDRLLTMVLREEDVTADTFSKVVEVQAQALRQERDGDGTERQKLRGILLDALPRLATADVLSTAMLIDRFYPMDHEAAILQLRGSVQNQLSYLQCFLDPHRKQQAEATGGEDRRAGGAFRRRATDNDAQASQGMLDPEHLPLPLRQRYIELLCSEEPYTVVLNLDARPTGFFDLEEVARACETARSYDAVLWSLDRVGRSADAFDALARFAAACALELGRSEAQEEPDFRIDATDAGAGERLQALVRMAVRLCAEHANRVRTEAADVDDGLDRRDTTRGLTVEAMWFKLLHTLMDLVHHAAPGPSAAEQVARAKATADSASPLLAFYREVVQDALVSLIASTSADRLSFPSLFRRLLSGEGHDPTQTGGHGGRYYTEVRAVLDAMLNAYRLRSELLGITNRLFDRDTYRALQTLMRQRRRGWRPLAAGARCGGCGEPAFGRAASELKAQRQQQRNLRKIQEEEEAAVRSGGVDVQEDAQQPRQPDGRNGGDERQVDTSPGSMDGQVRRNGAVRDPPTAATVASMIRSVPARRSSSGPYFDRLAASPKRDVKGKGVERGPYVVQSPGNEGANGLQDEQSAPSGESPGGPAHTTHGEEDDDEARARGHGERAKSQSLGGFSGAVSPASRPSVDPSESFSTLPTPYAAELQDVATDLEADDPRAIEAGDGGRQGGDEDDDALGGDALVVMRSGDVWHRRCLVRRVPREV